MRDSTPLVLLLLENDTVVQGLEESIVCLGNGQQLLGFQELVLFQTEVDPVNESKFLLKTRSVNYPSSGEGRVQ